MNISRIKELMGRDDINKSKLAKYLGITRVSVDNKLKGKTEFTVSELVAMSKKFHVKVEEII